MFFKPVLFPSAFHAIGSGCLVICNIHTSSCAGAIECVDEPYGQMIPSSALETSGNEPAGFRLKTAVPVTKTKRRPLL